MPDDNQSEPQDLSHLSPFVVLGKQQAEPVPDPAPGAPIAQSLPVASVPAAPSVPQPQSVPVALPPSLNLAPQPPVQPASAIPSSDPVPAPPRPADMPPPMPSREELLRQAAEAADTPLILPPDPEPVPAPPRPADMPPASEPKPVPIKASAEIPKPQPATPATPLPAPPKPQPAAEPVPRDPDIEVMHAHAKTGPGASGGHAVAAAIGGVVILAVILGGLFVLTLRGVRMPLLYPALSSLKTTGLAERDQALDYLAGQKQYQFGPDSQINLQLTQGGASTLANTVNPVSAVTTTVKDGGASLPGEQLSADVSVNSGGNIQVPLLYRTSGSSWTVSLPMGSKSSVQTVSASDVQGSLLVAALRPPALTELLKALTAQTSYSQQEAAGQRVAVYGYSVDGSKLADMLPTGSSFSGVKATVSYPWGDKGRPVSATLTGTLGVTDATYAYRGTFNYAAGAVSDSALQVLGSASGAIGISDFIAQLGFTAGSLPAGTSTSATSGSSTVTPVPATGASPAATATPTPAPALVPTGQSTATVLPEITAAPPAPATGASAQADANDAQRKADLSLLQTALENYKTATGAYPKTSGLEQVQASSTLLTALVPTYLTALPIDPTRTVYWYEYQSDGTTFILRGVAEDPTDPQAKMGTSYHYYEYDNK